MVDMKETGFMLFVTLIAISGVYEWAQSDDLLSEQLGVSGMDEFSEQSLQDSIVKLSAGAESIITTNPLSDLIGYINILVGFLQAVWEIFMKLMFGWTDLLNGIFTNVGLEGLSPVFIVPIAGIQIIAGLYFIRDLVNTLRGVS